MSNPLRFCAGAVLVFACSTAQAFTNSAWFTRVWQTDDGLPNNQVTSIVQGRDGYLWVGTLVGLARFDGFRFTKFSCSNPGGSQDEGVNDLWPSRAGGLWIRTRSGSLVCLDPDFSRTVPAAKGLPEMRVTAAVEDNDGCLWIAYPDAVWRVKKGQATRLTGYQNMVTAGLVARFVIDSDGNLWLAKGNGVFLFRPPSPRSGAAGNEHFELITNTVYRARLTAARSNGVWIASGKQLFKCDTNGLLQDYGTFSPDDIHAGSTVVLEDHTGAVWLGTERRLVSAWRIRF